MESSMAVAEVLCWRLLEMVSRQLMAQVFARPLCLFAAEGCGEALPVSSPPSSLIVSVLCQPLEKHGHFIPIPSTWA